MFDNISSTFYLNINLGVTSYDLYVPPKNILQMLSSIWKNKMLLPMGYSFKFNEETKIKCKKLFINKNIVWIEIYVGWNNLRVWRMARWK